MKEIFDVIARLFLSTLFIFEAYDSTVYFHKTKSTMALYGITWRPDFLLITTIILLVLGALLVVIGYYANIGAILLLMYIVPVTFIVHSFWNSPEDARHIQSLMFMKNIAIVGGLLLLLIHGAGKYSVKRLIKGVKVPH